MTETRDKNMGGRGKEGDSSGIKKATKGQIISHNIYFFGGGSKETDF
jgi:hypothetical protein